MLPPLVAAIDRLGVATVGELLQVPLRRIYWLPGSNIRKEVLDLTNLLRSQTDLAAGAPSGGEAPQAGELGEVADTSADSLAKEAFSFLKRRSPTERHVLDYLLGWEGARPASSCNWPSGSPRRRVCMTKTGVLALPSPSTRAQLRAAQRARTNEANAGTGLRRETSRGKKRL